MNRHEVRDFFAKLRGELDPSTGVKLPWIGYLFHVTHMDNVIEILNHGKLMSRSECDRLGIPVWDNASKVVLDGSDQKLSDFVRLYFRPRTPTFNRNEGFKSLAEMESDPLKAHCPVPVALIFDSAAVLGLPDARFSTQSLASYSNLSLMERTSNCVNDLVAADFASIYHDVAFRPDEKDWIIKARQAEVIVPNEMRLSGVLRGIRTRSDAERDTLLCELERRNVSFPQDLIRTSLDGAVFFSERLFIQSVFVVDGVIRIRFNLPGSRYSNFDWDFRLDLDLSYPGRPDLEPYSGHVSAVRRLLRERGSPLLTTREGVLNQNANYVLIQVRLDGNAAYRAVHYVTDHRLVGSE